MKKLVLLLCLLLSAPLIAQDRPISGTTVQTTDTTANSLLVGCAIGSTTCTGGIKSGPIVVNAITVINSTGQLAAAQLTGTCCGTATNVALLNASNTFTGLTQTIGSGGTGAAVGAVILNGGSAAGGGGFFTFQRNSLTQGYVGLASAIVGGTSDTIIYGNTGNGLGFYSNALLRWGVNSAGDFTFGASSHIALSNGTPVIASGFGTGSPSIGSGGTDYSFFVVEGTGASTTGQVNFGHTFSAAPVCIASGTNATGLVITTSTSTSVTLSYTSTTSNTIGVHCFGF